MPVATSVLVIDSRNEHTVAEQPDSMATISRNPVQATQLPS